MMEVCFSGSALAGVSGKLTYEIWNDVPGNKVEDVTDLPRFHGGPDRVTLIDGSVAPSRVGNNFASRLRGYIIAPVTGDYTFWVSGDNEAQLWMSPGISKFDKVKIAENSTWTNAQEWDKFETQQSETFRLEAGEKHYVELLHKELNGADHLAMAWSYSEVQPASNLTQLPGVIATQSTTYGTVSVAGNAVDGNTAGDYCRRKSHYTYSKYRRFMVASGLGGNAFSGSLGFMEP